MSIVTGEAVRLDIRPARLPTRMMATLVDLALILGFIYAWSQVSPSLTGSQARLDAISITVGLLPTLVYPVTMETLTKGRTVGAFALGLRVVRDDGGSITFRHALIRWLMYWFADFSILTGFCGGIICSILNRDGKRLGDLVAGTMVVRHRPPPALAEPPEVPEELRAWTSRLDLSRVDAELYATARNLVQRTGKMRPRTRLQLVTDVVAQLARRTTPPPPYSVSDEDFLICIVGERRARARAKLSEAEAAEQRRSYDEGLRRVAAQPGYGQVPYGQFGHGGIGSGIGSGGLGDSQFGAHDSVPTAEQLPQGWR